MQEEIFRLLIKKLSNELSKEESLKINKLIEENTDVRNEYKLLQQIWQDMPEEYIETNHNSLKKVQSKIVEFNQYRKKRIINDVAKYLVAASLLIFVIIFTFSQKKTVTIANDTNNIKTVILPDNSEVTLDTNAKISYQISLFQSFNREVNLKGNAFFSIKKQNGKTFTVNCNDLLDVEVLGTQFNIRQTSLYANVTLKKGKIKIYNFKKHPDTSFIMKPNEIVEYNNYSGKIIHQKTNVQVHTLWMKNKIEFDNYSLNDLAEIFKIYFGKTIVIKDSLLANKQIGGSAPTDDLSLILQALELITNTEIHESNDTIFFDKKMNY